MNNIKYFKKPIFVISAQTDIITVFDKTWNGIALRLYRSSLLV